MRAPAEASRAPIGSSRSTGLAVVVGLHVLVGWALASGLAKEVVQRVKKPIDVAVITEAPPPPPPSPPPPPKIERIKDLPKIEQPRPPPAHVPPPEVAPVAPPAPVIQAVQAEPPTRPVEVAPPLPAAPPEPVAVRQEISVACPGYQNVLASVLEEAIDRVGVEGTVRTLVKVRGNQVVDVTPQSGPKEYHRYVQTAVKRMKCSAGGADEVLVSLEVQFKR